MKTTRPADPDFAESLEWLDACADELDNTVRFLMAAIAAMSTDERVQGLAAHTARVVREFKDDVNLTAEEHGCNFVRQRGGAVPGRASSDGGARVAT